MSYVSVLPATLATAATEVARIGSALSLASAVAAAQTSAVQAAAADEVSAAIAALFSAHGRDFQALSARAAAFHHEFVQALAAGAGSYAVAEIAAASPLQSLIDVFNAPIQAATGRPLIGNGANGQPGTGVDREHFGRPPCSYSASPAADAVAALADASVGTVFAARPARLSARRFWVRYAAEATGALTLDAGAVRAVVRQRRSLLAAGITAVSGRFCGGDVVELRAPDAAMVARGVVAYDASELATMVGRSTSELPGELRRPVVHADDLVAVSAKQAKQV